MLVFHLGCFLENGKLKLGGASRPNFRRRLLRVFVFNLSVGHMQLIFRHAGPASRDLLVVERTQLLGVHHLNFEIFCVVLKKSKRGSM